MFIRSLLDAAAPILSSDRCSTGLLRWRYDSLDGHKQHFFRYVTRKHATDSWENPGTAMFCFRTHCVSHSSRVYLTGVVRCDQGGHYCYRQCIPSSLSHIPSLDNGNQYVYLDVGTSLTKTQFPRQKLPRITANVAIDNPALFQWRATRNDTLL